MKVEAIKLRKAVVKAKIIIKNSLHFEWIIITFYSCCITNSLRLDRLHMYIRSMYVRTSILQGVSISSIKHRNPSDRIHLCTRIGENSNIPPLWNTLHSDPPFWFLHPLHLRERESTLTPHLCKSYIHIFSRETRKGRQTQWQW